MRAKLAQSRSPPQDEKPKRARPAYARDLPLNGYVRLDTVLLCSRCREVDGGRQAEKERRGFGCLNQLVRHASAAPPSARRTRRRDRPMQ